MCRNEGYWLFQWIQNPPNYALVTAHGLGWYMSNRNIQREYCIAISSCMVHGYGSKPTGALVFTPKLLLVMPCYIYVTYPSSWSISPWSCILKVPSGKLTKNYIWKITIMGKLTISMAIFNSYVSHYQRVMVKSKSVWPIPTDSTNVSAKGLPSRSGALGSHLDLEATGEI